MDPALLQQLIRTDPQKAAALIQSAATPTEALRNLGQLQHMGGGPGGTANPALKDITSGVVSGIAGTDNAAMISAQAAWRANPKTCRPARLAMPWHPNDLQSFTQYKSDQQELSTSVAKAAGAHADAVPTLISMQQRIEDVKNNPALDTMMSNQAKKDQAQYLLNSDPNTPWAV